MRRHPASLLLAFVLPGCDERGYDEPSPDSEDVTLPIAGALVKRFNADDTPISFSEASTELIVTVVGQKHDSSHRTLNLAYPKEARFTGYGRFAGMVEVHERSLAVDENGVHGVRQAVYRTDAGNNHSNAWFSHLASAINGGVWLTHLAYWDWQSGDADTEGFNAGVWPIVRRVAREGLAISFTESAFSVVPTVFSDTSTVLGLIMDTDAVSPTGHVPDCVAIQYGSADASLTHLVYLHERLGLVEVVYEFDNLPFGDEGGVVIELAPPVPLDGFVLDVDSVVDPAPILPVFDFTGLLTFPEGVWTSTIEEQTPEAPPLAFVLELWSSGDNYAKGHRVFEIDGLYEDDVTGPVELHGVFNASDASAYLVSARTTDVALHLSLAQLPGTASNFRGAMRFQLANYRNAPAENIFASGALQLAEGE